MILANYTSLLVILCGLPSSGKSWFAKSLADNLSSQINFMNIEIIDMDKVRTQLFESEFLSENESFVRETALLETRKYLELNSIVIVDDINYFNSMRQEFRQIALELHKHFLILYISTPLKVCLEWNDTRKNRIDKKIISNIGEKFDVPGKKYLWDVPFEVIDISTDDTKNKIRTISNYIQKLVQSEKITPESEAENKATSIKYEIDLLTRIFIAFYADQIFATSPNKALNETNDEKSILYKIVVKITSQNPLFKKIQTQYSNNIGRLNTERRKFMENSQFRDNLLTDGNSEIKLIQILVDFMHYLLK